MVQYEFKKTITFLFAISVAFLSFSQKITKVYYLETSNFNISNLGLSKSNNVKKNEREYLLQFNDSLGEYKNISNTKNDILDSFLGYKGSFLYDIKKRKTYRKQGKYLIEKGFENYNWELTGETSIIDTLVCYKATTSIKVKGKRRIITKQVIAWYTTEICTPIGPKGFSGLPGLIVELKIDKVTICLNKINYLQKDLNVNFLKSGRKFNEIEFEVFIDSLTQNINLKPH